MGITRWVKALGWMTVRAVMQLRAFGGRASLCAPARQQCGLAATEASLQATDRQRALSCSPWPGRLLMASRQVVRLRCVFSWYAHCKRLYRQCRTCNCGAVNLFINKCAQPCKLVYTSAMHRKRRTRQQGIDQQPTSTLKNDTPQINRTRISDSWQPLNGKWAQLPGVTGSEAMPANNSKGIKTASVPRGVALESRSWSRCRPGDASSSAHRGEAPWFERTRCPSLDEREKPSIY